jgi:hypothetical protein
LHKRGEHPRRGDDERADAPAPPSSFASASASAAAPELLDSTVASQGDQDVASGGRSGGAVSAQDVDNEEAEDAKRVAELLRANFEGEGDAAPASARGAGQGASRSRADSDGDDAEAKEANEAALPAQEASAGLGRASATTVDPFVPISAADYQVIREHYGLGDDCPVRNLFVRGEAGARASRVYFLGDGIASLVRNFQDRLKVVHAGLRVFDRSRGATPSYRVCQEGIQYILPHVTRQVLTLPVSDFLTLLEKRMLTRDKFTDAEAKSLIINKLLPGGLIVRLAPGALPGLQHPVAVASWLTVHAVTVMITKEDSRHLLQILGPLAGVPVAAPHGLKRDSRDREAEPEDPDPSKRGKIDEKTQSRAAGTLSAAASGLAAPSSPRASPSAPPAAAAAAASRPGK